MTTEPLTAGSATTARRIRRTPFNALFTRRDDYLQHPLKTWPYTWHSVGRFILAFVVLTAAFVAVGFAITTWWEPSSIGQAEADVSVWLEENRTDTLDTAAHVLSVPSNTFVKVGLVAVAMVVFPLVFRRWHDWAFLLGALLLEVSVYGASSTIVGRERPDVERLTTAPTQSFPSGHMAASITFYVALVMIVYWNTTDRRPRIAALLLGVLIPVGMFVSRLYLGMHFISDMVGGIVLGFLSLVVALNIARDGLESTNAEIDELQAPQVEAFDLTADQPDIAR